MLRGYGSNATARPLRKQTSPGSIVTTRRRSLALVLERLEARVTPTTYTVSSGVVSDLITAINAANTAGGSNTIDLSGTYDITAVDNYWYGPDGLPAITSDLTIEGDPTNGAIIERSAAPLTPNFRIFYVAAAQSGLTQGTLTLENVTLDNGVAQDLQYATSRRRLAQGAGGDLPAWVR